MVEIVAEKINTKNEIKFKSLGRAIKVQAEFYAWNEKLFSF